MSRSLQKKAACVAWRRARRASTGRPSRRRAARPAARGRPARPARPEGPAPPARPAHPATRAPRDAPPPRAALSLRGKVGLDALTKWIIKNGTWEIHYVTILASAFFKSFDFCYLWPV